MNYAANCFPTHFILQVSLLVSFICSQTWRDSSEDRDFYQMKRSNGKAVAILEAMTAKMEKNIEYPTVAARLVTWTIELHRLLLFLLNRS